MAEPLIRITARDAETGESLGKVTITPLTEQRAPVCGKDFCDVCGCCLGCGGCTFETCCCLGNGEDDG